MKVKIKLFATLRKFGPDEQMLEIPEESTLEDAISRLKLPENMPLLKIVNGEHRPARHVLKEGDEVALFPPIAGGEGCVALQLLPADPIGDPFRPDVLPKDRPAHNRKAGL